LDPTGTTVNYEPTNADRVTRLQDSTKKGLCKLSEKKKLLKKVFDAKEALLKIADHERFDTGPELANFFQKKLVSNHHVNNNCKNADVAALVVDLFDFFEAMSG